jgi:acyl-CoA synthetase (AMP-forming)/AMP-acid ligase II
MLKDVPKLLPSAKVNPAALLHRRATERPGDLALTYLDERYSWSQVQERASQWANWAASRGVRSGDVLALVMENRPDYLFAVMGLNQIGAVAALINTNLRGAALAHALRVCNPRMLVVGEECVEPVVAVESDLEGISREEHIFVKRDDGGADAAGLTVMDDELAAASSERSTHGYTPSNSDVYCYIYTSGTTGLPKAAIIRNQRMLGANLSFGHLMHRARASDTIYVTLPLYHSSAMFLGWGPALATGASMALRRKFSASGFWEDVHRFGATSFIYIGELCRYLLNQPPSDRDRGHRIRVCVGNGLRPDIWETFQERFGIPVVREFYGSTEGNAPLINLEGRPGMIGKLQRGQVLVRCDPMSGELLRDTAGRAERIGPGEVGLLLGRISKVIRFDGYLDQAATNKALVSDVFEDGDQYFNTGDLLELHEGNWLSFADRAGDTFRWKGENVSTNEVAEILDGGEGVLEANVYGVEVPGTEGRAGMAAISTSEDFDLERFTRHIDGNLASYQRPLFIRLLSGGMRVTATFKHQKVEYRDEGFDLERVDDPVYVRDGAGFVPLTPELVDEIERGERTPG